MKGLYKVIQIHSINKIKSAQNEKKIVIHTYNIIISYICNIENIVIHYYKDK